MKEELNSLGRQKEFSNSKVCVCSSIHKLSQKKEKKNILRWGRRKQLSSYSS